MLGKAFVGDFGIVVGHFGFEIGVAAIRIVRVQPYVQSFGKPRISCI